MAKLISIPSFTQLQTEIDRLDERIDDIDGGGSIIYQAILSTTWVGDAAPYSQTITVDGMLATDKPFFDVLVSDDVPTGVAQAEAWGCVTRLIAGNNSVTALCYTTKPTVEIPFQIVKSVPKAGAEPPPAKKDYATLIVGTSASGHTLDDVDYLCDGVDDQVEINAAIQALPEIGGKVILYDGTYNLTGRILLNRNNITIEGLGRSTLIKRMYTESTDGGLIMMTNVSYCTISNIQFDGNRVAYNNNRNYSVYISGGRTNLIKECVLNNHYHALQLIGSTEENRIINNTFDTSNSYSDSVSVHESNNNRISENKIIGNKGIYVYDSARTSISGNFFQIASHSTAIYLHGTSPNTIISDNIFTSVTSSYTSTSAISIGYYETYEYKPDITVYAAHHTSVCNNMFTGLSLAISVTCSDDVNISGNTFDNVECAIMAAIEWEPVAMPDHLNITGNIMRGPAMSAGITLNVNNSTINGNILSGYYYGIHLNYSANNTVVGNTVYDTTVGITCFAAENTLIMGNTCMRGTGKASDYTASQCTLDISYGSYNLVSSNNIMGKNYVSNGETGSTFINNKYN